MNNEKYINNITLEYLLNPNLYEKINDQKNDVNQLLLLEDIIFYKQRICKLTKDMCKGNYTNNNLKNIFINYASTIVYYLKQLDEKDILQSEYDNMETLDNSNIELNDISNSNYLTNNIIDTNNLIINKPKISNNLDNFIKKVNIVSTEKIIPKKRIINIKDHDHKIKGVKTKNKKEKSCDNINETIQK